MDIISYLTAILKTHKEVGIEGLGTFSRKKIPGRYDSENHTFVPPVYSIELKSGVNEVSLLREYISVKRSISTESADYYISVFLEEVNNQLEQTGEAGLGEIGVLSKNETGIFLKENKEMNLGYGSYGLPVLQADGNERKAFAGEEPKNEPEEEALEPADLDTAQNDDQETFEEISEFEAPKYHVSPSEIETTENVVENVESDFNADKQEPEDKATASPELEDEEQEIGETQQHEVQSSDLEDKTDDVAALGTANIWHFDRTYPSTNNESSLPADPEVSQSTPLWLKLAIAAGIIAVALVALYFIRPSIFGVKTTTNSDAEKIKPKQKMIAVDSAKRIDTLKVIPPVIKTDSLTDSLPVDSATTWEIIGASLTKREVKKYIADMKAKGIVAKPIPAMPGRRIKMSIATFPDEESAKVGRRALVKKLKNDDLYIHQNKHTYKPL